MIRISIDGQVREGIDEGWIARVISEIRRGGSEPCVRVTAKRGDVDVALQAGACSSGGGGGGRAPNPREAEIIAAWQSCTAIRTPDYPIGQLIQCLKRLERGL